MIKYGKTGWFDIRGNDEDKYVEEQGGLFSK